MSGVVIDIEPPEGDLRQRLDAGCRGDNISAASCQQPTGYKFHHLATRRFVAWAFASWTLAASALVIIGLGQADPHLTSSAAFGTN